MNPRLGILLTLLSYVLMTGESAAVHALGSDVSLLQLTLLRGVGGLALVAMLARGLVVPVWTTNRLLLQIGRGLLSFISMLAIFYSLSALPLATRRPCSIREPSSLPSTLAPCLAKLLRRAVGGQPGSDCLAAS